MNLYYLFSLIKGCSNNMVEYDGVITRFELALQIAISNLTIYGDSKLIVK